jgi:hypothetical protein
VRGQKRSFDFVDYVDASKKFVTTKERTIIHFQPFMLWKLPGLAEGKSLGELEAEWKLLTEGPGAEAKFEYGQWLLPVFHGVERITDEGNTQASTTSRRAPLFIILIILIIRIEVLLYIYNLYNLSYILQYIII